MTNYHLSLPPTLPSFSTQEAKEKRKQILAQAAKVRRANYLAFLKKRRLQASSNVG